MSLPILEDPSCGTHVRSGCSSGSCLPAAAATVPTPRRPAAPKVPPPEVSRAAFAGTQEYPEGLMIGLDVGSTTIKAVVVDPVRDEILWQDYQRHETRQAEKTLAFFAAIEQAFRSVPAHAFRVFTTGSGGAALLPHIGGKFVQEVNAVSLAVEKLHPEARSVVELGGQDAKIIIFKEMQGGDKKKIPSMNDKCAGGTGAVIDKISAKLRIPPEDLSAMAYHGIKLHPVAGKCGVFAETDINSLQKQGAPPEELMASLFESIIQQNLSVLTRGHTLRPTVLLLGGPNTYIRGMRECWQHNIPILWRERGVVLPDRGRAPEDFIVTPDNAHLFAAIGAVEFGKVEVGDHPDVGLYLGCERLRWYLDHGRAAERAADGMRGLSKNREELAAFRKDYAVEPWRPASFQPGEVVEAILGIDGGSTSTKGVLLGTNREILAKAYQLSKNNPIEDTMEIIADLERQVTTQGARLEVLAAGTTGYAKDILRDVLKADVALVETVAHTKACLHYYPGAEVIVDVGGQDIKLIMLKQGRVKDFKLNTQCSAGNGYFLQSTAKDFGFDVIEYAEVAFGARSMPDFGFGCAVFLQSDIVDFQRKGWQADEIMAGLAAVLPKNVWLYVAQIPNLARLGSKFVLQGGTHHNLAVVKAQVDFIRSRFGGTGVEPEILVHKHCAESGAIGCALEAHRLWIEGGGESTFIGTRRVRRIHFTTTRGETTRCFFCKNKCLRTFVDVALGDPPARGSLRLLPPVDDAAQPLDTTRPGSDSEPERGSKGKPKVPLAPGYQRLIISTCEKGSVEDVSAMRQIKADVDAIKENNPNFVELATRNAFREPKIRLVADPPPRLHLLNVLKKSNIETRRARMERRKEVRIGLPRVLNSYAQAPFFLGYFTSLGVPFENLVFSAYTDQELYKRGAKRGSIDPCYPSKLGIPHIHDLLERRHRKKPLSHIFFPMVDTFPTALHGVQASHTCPTVAATPEATHAAFIKEGDVFESEGIVFKKTFLNLDEPLLAARQMYRDWKIELGLSLDESVRAVEQGLRALSAFYDELREHSRRVLTGLENEDRIGIVVLGRPYHNDPGVNHGVLESLQKHGYPIFWQDALPRDQETLDRLFGAEVRAGIIDHPLSIDDVWKNSFSENSSRKLWAAKYTARHPNLVALELSSFKCGHDAPIYSVIESIVESSGTPYFSFKDIDENKAAGSIKIRIETIVYFLERYRERLVAEAEPSPWMDDRPLNAVGAGAAH